MKFNELIQGKIYVTDKKSPGYIFKCEGDCRTVAFTYNNFRGGYNPYGHLNAEDNSFFSDYREATYEEAMRWEACLQAKAIVPMPEIDYSIF